ncbi:SDR family oxidoreductase [Paraburkholderia caballeronis]|uniref:Uncharacterized oxidoreductase n=1 Tax=Paraburkholderia caballeronis TaxID=416943 RepID=A0A1H7P1P3_9BURK|nr:SDR family NAD(P)-dependent oxidoreductase [Paraburkholderia caballeronis]PXW25446.1 putative oxidoreductase [Paraburkholderia caballeronis]PXX01053.1 putative oxidoreductase [Paraburkholderia caballeronis]RAJ99594.1 putative oxidoreductase [Paraburkholderia caballeronis]SEE37071.1 uncharacterized oxidoreductase [Paraburkholderia caballeronis]SEL29155.1 uncharacterized oxidoreductase [Paraburkholderia caballeronis]
MRMTDNTILITGGTSGIGLELAQQFIALGNDVIVVGRNPARLDALRVSHPKLHVLRGDVGDPRSVAALYEQVAGAFPDLNVLVNSAGIMRKIDLQRPDFDLADVTREVEANLNGTIWMDVQFLAHLKQKQNAAIVNVSSGLAFVPMPIAPVYCATKAAIHAFTLSLRVQLRNTPVKVFELAPPGTDTPLFHGEFAADDGGGIKPMAVDVLARHAIDGMRRDVLEIRPGLANVLKLGSRIAPNFMLAQTSRSVDAMHGNAGSRRA